LNFLFDSVPHKRAGKDVLNFHSKERILQEAATLTAGPTGFLVTLQIGISANQFSLVNLSLELVIPTDKNLTSPNTTLSYVKVSVGVLECLFSFPFPEGERLCFCSFLVPAPFSAEYWVANVWVG